MNLIECPNCQNKIKENTKKCGFCHVIVERQPIKIFLCNLILPGLGYLIKEKFTKAILLALLILIGYNISIIFGMIIHFGIIVDSLLFE